MKKLAVVALALVIAMSFVGCGLASQLLGTKWEIRDEDDYFTAMEFKADDEVVMSVGYDNVTSYSAKGTWTVDGDELTVSVAGVTYTAIAEIDGDKLTLDYSNGTKEVWTRVK